MPRIQTWGPWAFFLLIFGFVAGCSAPQVQLCQLSLIDPNQAEAEEEEDDDEDSLRVIRPVRPEEWLSLIVNSEVGQDASEICTGSLIAPPDPSEECREAAEERRQENPDSVDEEETLREVELSDESIVDYRLNNSKRLVWIITHRFSGGDGLGPVALIERRETEDESTINVIAMGVLRSRTERPRIRLLTIREPLLSIDEQLECPEPEDPEEEVDPEECERTEHVLIAEGVECRDQDRPETCQLSRELRRDDSVTCTDSEDPETCWRLRQMLVAEGETCEDPEDPATCLRAAEFMFREGDRFVQPELFHVNGECLGRSTMHFTNRTEQQLPGGWQREFNLSASHEFINARIVIHQQVVATDQYLREPEIPPRPYREAEDDIFWYPYEMRFITSTQSLWERMLIENASLQVPPDRVASY